MGSGAYGPTWLACAGQSGVSGASPVWVMRTDVAREVWTPTLPITETADPGHLLRILSLLSASFLLPSIGWVTRRSG